MNDLYIIDFQTFGNVVRFYLCTATQYEDAHGDDWDDCPYEHNAGVVYDRYITGFIDIGFNADVTVFEPADGEWNSNWCKYDFKERKCPIIAIAELPESDWCLSFKDLIARDDSIKIYMADSQKELIEELEKANLGTVLKHEVKKH